MEYILCMTAAGSGMTLMYLLFRKWFPDGCFEKRKYFFLKICVLFYLLPLLFLKTPYQRAIESLPFVGGAETSPNSGIVYTWHDRATLVIGQEKNYWNPFFVSRIFWVGLWEAGGILCLLIQIYKGWKVRREMIRAVRSQAWEKPAAFQTLCEEYHIHRRVEIYGCPEGNYCFTIGVFRPVIFCAGENPDWETEMLLRHELVHIKNWDALWNLLSILVLGLHWFQPLAWFLRGEIKRSRELVCDREVLAGRGEEEKKRYMTMLVLRAGRKKTGAAQIDFFVRSSRSKASKRMEERIRKIQMSEKKGKPWGKAASVILIAGMTFVNSLTALAYPEIQVVRMDETNEAGQDMLQGYLEGDTIYVPNGEVNPLEIPPDRIYYPVQFTDGEGNVYPVEETQGYTDCSHTYVDGICAKHLLLASGGCVYRTYLAQRCSKCGTTVLGKLIGTQVNNPCPH